jgi:hypothetical protein
MNILWLKMVTMFTLMTKKKQVVNEVHIPTDDFSLQKVLDTIGKIELNILQQFEAIEKNLVSDSTPPKNDEQNYGAQQENYCPCATDHNCYNT